MNRPETEIGCSFHDPCARRRDLAEERLVDVDEWCAAHGVPPLLPFPAVMTAALCDAIERLPFRMIGRTTARERGRQVIVRAAASLDRAVYDWAEEARLAACLSATFAAPIPCHATDPGWRLLKIHWGASDGGKPELTLALAGELEA